MLRGVFCNYVRHIPRALRSLSTVADSRVIDARTVRSQQILEGVKSGEQLSSADLSTVVKLSTEASEAGCIRGTTILACLKRDGLGVPRDTERAFELLHKCAQDGDHYAQFAYGMMLLQKAEQPSIESKVTSLENAYVVVEEDEQGNRRGRLQVDDDDVPLETPAQIVRAVRKSRKKAGFSDAEAMEYEQHKVEEKRKQIDTAVQKAMTWLHAAAEQGNDAAMVAIANRLVHTHPHRAVSMYEKAIATNRNTDAYYNLGQIYTKGLQDISPDHKKAFKNFAMAAQLGDASAQFYLGQLYRSGSQHVEAHPANALQYIQLAAAQQHPAALFYLAQMHLEGEAGLEPSQSTFRKYLTMSAAVHYAPALAYLADMYYKGTHDMQIDHAKALEYFLQAGTAGDADALCSAAAMHFHGHGTKSDKHKAFLLYQDAAQLGSLAAMQNLGAMYYHGDGVPRSVTMAEHFFRIVESRQKESLQEAEHILKQPVRKEPAPELPNIRGAQPEQERN